MKKRIVSILLAAIMIFSLLPATAFAETGEGETVEVGTWADFRNAVKRADESLTIELTEDITASGTYTYGDAWEFFGRKTRVIDLNDHTFDLNKYHLFVIHDATVTIKNGTITNGNGDYHHNYAYNFSTGLGYDTGNTNSASGESGAIWIDGGTVTLENLTITDCTASRGFKRGGAICCDGGDVTLDDVTIKNCSASRGGAIYVGGYRTFTIKGNSKIGVENAGNQAETGGGICISGDAYMYSEYGYLPTLNLRGNTEIRYNTATSAYNPGTASADIETNQKGGGGGVAVYPYSKVTFGGSVKITDNTAPVMSQKDSDTSALSNKNNLFIVSDYNVNDWYDPHTGFYKAWRIGFAEGDDAPVYSGDNKMQVGVTLGTSNTTIGASSFKWTSEGIFSDNTAKEEYVDCFIPDFNDRKVSINSSNELLIGEVHGHNFTYSTSTAGDAIEAKCTSSCDEGYYNTPLTLTLAAGGTYSGEPIEASLLNKDTFAGKTGKTIGNITYYLEGGTTATTSENSGATTEGAAPVNAGSYVAKVTVSDINDENVTLEKPFTITQAAATITAAPTASAITYGQTLSASELSGGSANVNGSFAWKYGTTAPKVSDSGTTGYDVVFTPTDANYAAAECEVTLQVNQKPVTVQSVTVADKVYNGKSDNVSITGYTLNGKKDGDDLTISGITGTYADVNVGDAKTVNLSGTWELGGSDAGNYVLATEGQPTTTTGKITALNLSGATVTLVPTAKDYTGSEITSLTVTVKDSNENVIPSTDYTVSYSNNINAAAATDNPAPTVTVTANTGNVTGSKSATFTINKAAPPAGTPNAYEVNAAVYSELSLETIGVTLQGAKITGVEAVSGKTGKVITGTPSIINDGKAISWTTKDNPSGTVNDQYKLTVSTDNWTDFTITVDFKGKIPVTFSGLTTVGNVTYDGQPETGVAGTAVCTAGGQDVTEGCGTLVYTYYKDSVNEANKLNNAPVDAGSYVLLVSVADSNTTYIGTSAPFAFTIAKKEITIEWAEDEFTYNKQDQTASITASYKDIAEASHPLIVAVKKGSAITAFMNAGDYTAEITGFDTVGDAGSKNYKLPDTVTKDYTMKQATVTVKDIAVQDKVYDGETNNVIFTGAATFEGRCGDDELTLSGVKGEYYSANRSGNQRVDLTNGYAEWTLAGAAAENYQFAESGHVEYVFGKILQASQSAPIAPEVSGDKVTIAETDREKNLEYCVDDVKIDAEKAWISVPTLDNGMFTLAGLSADDHTIYLRVKESNNYAASASVNTAFTLTQFSVAYNANGGIGSIASQTATAPTTLTVASGSGFSRTGYTFDGWKDESGASHAVGSTVSTGMTLYAQWTANTYKVNFNANGGTGTMGDQSFTYDEEPKALTAKPEGFKKDGYTFVGWATSANGPVLYSDKQEVKNLAGNGTVTLYAVWTQAAYSITVNVSSPNNGNEVKIKLRQGNAVYASTTANSMTTPDDVLWKDSKTFANVPAGTYNVEATQVIEGSKNVTMTQLVVLTAEALTVDIALPVSGINSTLEVTKDTLPTVVGGLDVEAEFNRQYGKDITVAMTVEKQEAQELAATAGAEDKATQAAIKEIKATANGKALDFMNIEVKKTTVESGQPDVTEAITETSNVLELVFSYEMNGKKNIQLYREHDGAVLTFEKLNEKPTVPYTDGKFYVDTANSLIYVYAKQFSTYAIGYEQVYSGGGSSSYAIESESVKNGTVSVDKKSAYAGSTVTITVTPDKGFTLETLTVLNKNGKEIEVKNLGNNKYSFKMPASKVTVSATFMEDNTMLNFFVDVKATDYYYDAVLWAAENGITQGTDAVHFSPNMGTTRAQVVTFLWRAAGCPEPNGDASKFTDVVVGSYYEKAVAWAIEQGITKGTTETTFSPYVVCTRGQIVTFLARFAGVADEAAGYTHGFTDVKATDYFNNAVAWAKDNKVTEGTSAAMFSPKQDCTRAQVVTFLYRWMVK